MKNQYPLVSIIVITYNNSKHVIESLESAKAQTYRNIELIISDDCSKDTTVEICRKWLTENRDRFVRTELITVSENTGIPANCNRGVKASKGKWIKLIAGDDALINNCIQANINFVTSDSTIKFCFSDCEKYQNNFSPKSLMKNNASSEKLKKYGKLTSENQLKILIYKCFIPAPTVFLNSLEFRKVGFFDETYWFVEDVTTWYNILKSGNKFYYLDIKTIKYRIHNASITKSRGLVFPNQFFLIERMLKERFYIHYSFIAKILFHYKYFYLKKYNKQIIKSTFGGFTQRFLYLPILFEEKLKNYYVHKILKKQ